MGRFIEKIGNINDAFHIEKEVHYGILYYMEKVRNETVLSDEETEMTHFHLFICLSRVNGILRSSDEFSEAFQCSDNMYMNPMEKCRIFG